KEESIEEKIEKIKVSEELDSEQQKEAKEFDAAPIKQNAYKAAPGVKEFIKNEITQLKKKGLIRESQSSWSSPVMVVPKKGGKLRLCIDYRKLNAVMKKDSYPLPRVDDLLETFSKARWFSSLDLLSGYWQLP
ncbi:7893_t:CDS:2, partial [Dentiscutata erythropus]